MVLLLLFGSWLLISFWKHWPPNSQLEFKLKLIEEHARQKQLSAVGGLTKAVEQYYQARDDFKKVGHPGTEPWKIEWIDHPIWELKNAVYLEKQKALEACVRGFKKKDIREYLVGRNPKRQLLEGKMWKPVFCSYA